MDTPISISCERANQSRLSAFANLVPPPFGIGALGRPAASARNLWELEVSAVTVTGQRTRVMLRGIPGVELVAEVTLAAVAELRITTGSTLWAGVKATEIEVYPA